MALVPKVQWAQRADRLYLTIDLQDAKEPKVDISNDAEGKFGKVTFKGEGRSHATGAEKHQYSLDLDLYKVIVMPMRTGERSAMFSIPCHSSITKYCKQFRCASNSGASSVFTAPFRGIKTVIERRPSFLSLYVLQRM